MLHFRLGNLLLLTAFATFRVWGQSAGTGALTGTVTDPSSAVIANATVTVTNIDTNQSRTATTGADGSYRFSLLPPGNYRVRFTAAGFKTSEVVSSQTEQSTVEANA
jgi:hypothetical protein